VELLAEHGPVLPYAYSPGITTSLHRHMRELRIQFEGRPYRVLSAFDPRRTAILLLDGDETGDRRWYEVNVPRADALCDEHVRTLRCGDEAARPRDDSVTRITRRASSDGDDYFTRFNSRRKYCWS
jgi:hypothetical protein